MGNPASTRAAATPASHAPLAPPPDSTSAIGASGDAARDPAHFAGSPARAAGAEIAVTSAKSSVSGLRYRIGLCLQLWTFRSPRMPGMLGPSPNPIPEGDDDQRS